MVAVVMKNQQDFSRYAQREGFRAPNGLLGYYSVQNNRVALYDVGAGRYGKPRCADPYQDLA